MNGPWIYRVEWVRWQPGQERQLLASYDIPESIFADVTVNSLTTDGILSALKRRLKEEVKTDG